jgi:Acetyl-CoA dehydrogenase C-terminal like
VTSVIRMTEVTAHLVGVIRSDPARGLATGAAESDEAFYQGKIQAARFYYGFELTKNDPDADLLLRNDPSALEMRGEWF